MGAMFIGNRFWEPEELADLVVSFRELTQRRLERRLGDCQAYWEHDAGKLLEKSKCFAMAATKTSATRT